MNLSPNFTLEELIRTSTGLPNHPTAPEVAKLTDLCTSILQPIRDKWGPLHIDSGFRCNEVNKAVGGSITSQHRLGEAADFVPLDAEIPEVFEWIVAESGIIYGQAIMETKGKYGHSIKWIHISLPGKHKNEALIFLDGEYQAYKA